MPFYEVLVVREVTQTARVSVHAKSGREAEEMALLAKVPDGDWTSPGNESRRVVPGETRVEIDMEAD